MPTIASRLPWPRTFQALAAAAAIALPAVAAAPAAAAPAALTPAVERAAADAPQRPVRVVVQLDAATPMAEGRALLRAAGAGTLREVRLIRAFGATLPAHAAARVASAPGVRAVSLDAGIKGEGAKLGDHGRTAAWQQSLGATTAWEAGKTGRGVGIAVIDTGVKGDLPDFARHAKGKGPSRVAANLVTNPDAQDAGDAFGHGTHVAGIAAANGAASGGRHRGVAPDAHIVAIKADDGHGATTVLDVIAGLQFAVDHKDEHNLRVVNLSLRSTESESYLTDPLDAAAEAAWNAGLVVVAASGNLGEGERAVDYAPANDPFVITVGATDDQGTPQLTDDTVPTWSSRGTTRDGVAKPEVLAPGARIVSQGVPGSEYAKQCPTCVVENGHFRASGTSMAAGAVSGAVAVIAAAHPDWTPDQIKATLVATGRPVAGSAAPQVALDQVLAGGRPAPATRPALPANELLSPATGEIDYERVSWSRVSWSTAVAAQRVSWSRVSWSMAPQQAASADVEAQRVSWSRVSWSRVSWSAILA